MSKTFKILLVIAGVILAGLIIVPTVMGTFFRWHNYWGIMGPGMMGGYGDMGFMGLFWIVLLGLLVWFIVAGTRGTHHSGIHHSGGHYETALDILKKKYASGEIDKAEFEEKKKDIS